jgi:5-methylcytosine-specific restriction protein B
VIANKGISKILAVGSVTTDGYRFDDRRATHKHTLSVEWDTSYEKTIPEQRQWAFVTIADLTEEQWRLIFDASSPEALPILPPSCPNQILYGPPGTGKTYQGIRRAAEIVDGCSYEGRDDDAKAAFDRHLASGRVRFATFHQSFSYEDFIEGIRPVMEGGEARFQVRDGLFKTMAIEALFACLEPVPAVGADGKYTRPEAGSKTGIIWDLADQLVEELGRVPTGKEIWERAIAQGSVPNTAKTQASRWRQLRGQADTEPLSKDEVVSSYLADGPASGWRLREDGIFPPYVLVIDEINRGNISRIFGELITLIEDDKREGRRNGLRVTLPCSQELFAVPPNLFLLGTMNTADKSLALLDVALRRRFEFRELAPDFSLCKRLPEPMRRVLERLNERIELRKDRDHRIGHAFFMEVADVESFNRAFSRRVVPLLQEYFFNDIDGARYVLGEEREDGLFLQRIGSNGSESRLARNRWRWFTDVEPRLDCWARLEATLGGGSARSGVAEGTLNPA